MGTKLILKISMTLDAKRFDNLFKNIVLRKSDDVIKTDEGFADYILEPIGIVIAYRNSQYKKMITLIIDTDKLNDDNSISNRINDFIDDYFDHIYSIDNFMISSLTVYRDINVGTYDNIIEYLHILQRLGKVKGFLPPVDTSYESIFSLTGNSNCIDFMAYNPENIIIDRLHHDYILLKRVQNIDQSNNILRLEVNIKRSKSMYKYMTYATISNQINELIDVSDRIFEDTFIKIMPPGNFYKKREAVKMIQTNIRQSVMRRKMLRVIELIPIKKSLYLAIKTANYRNIDEVMDKFRQLNLSPITISKRQNVTFLKSFYEYL